MWVCSPLLIAWCGLEEDAHHLERSAHPTIPLFTSIFNGRIKPPSLSLVGYKNVALLQCPGASLFTCIAGYGASYNTCSQSEKSSSKSMNATVATLETRCLRLPNSASSMLSQVAQFYRHRRHWYSYETNAQQWWKMVLRGLVTGSL